MQRALFSALGNKKLILFYKIASRGGSINHHNFYGTVIEAFLSLNISHNDLSSRYLVVVCFIFQCIENMTLIDNVQDTALPLSSRHCFTNVRWVI